MDLEGSPPDPHLLFPHLYPPNSSHLHAHLPNTSPSSSPPPTFRSSHPRHPSRPLPRPPSLPSRRPSFCPPIPEHGLPSYDEGADFKILNQAPSWCSTHGRPLVREPSFISSTSSPGLQMEARPTEDTDRQTLLYCVLTGLAVLTICLIVYIIGGDEDNTLPAN